MDSHAENTRRIAKNTLMLYVRMLFQMLVAFYTARIIFNTLGTNDYGLYNLVAGCIVFFSFLNIGLNTATKRFITSEIASGTIESQTHVFNICLVAHLLICAIVLVLSETLGLWVVNHILNIPAGRLVAANWVFQMSVFCTILGIVQSPYEVAIIAHERMSIFAYFGIFDIVLKLLIALALPLFLCDKLIIYSILLSFTFIITIIVYRGFCYRNFEMCIWKYSRDPLLLKKIFSFMGWSLFGQLATIGTSQGVGILVNVYYNVAANAAIGVSNQIVGNVNKFVSNYQTAFNPQIIKSYANRDYDYLNNLILRTSKLSSFLIIVFLIPLVFEMNNVLYIWLGNYPMYSVEFCQLTFFSIYLEAIVAPLWMLIYSQTDIKNYQIVISLVYGSIFFITWGMIDLWNVVPYSVIYIRIAIFLCLLFIRLYYVRRFLSVFSIGYWLKEVLLRGCLVMLVAGFVTGICSNLILVQPLLHVGIIVSISLVCTILCIYYLGLNHNERKAVCVYVKRKISGLFNYRVL